MAFERANFIVEDTENYQSKAPGLSFHTIVLNQLNRCIEFGNDDKTQPQFNNGVRLLGILLLFKMMEEFKPIKEKYDYNDDQIMKLENDYLKNLSESRNENERQNIQFNYTRRLNAFNREKLAICVNVLHNLNYFNELDVDSFAPIDISEPLKIDKFEK